MSDLYWSIVLIYGLLETPFQIYLIEKIERVQTKLKYHERLHVLNLESLELRRIKIVLKLCYKIVKGFCYLDCRDFFYFCTLFKH